MALSDRQRKARREYRQSVDEAYRTVADLRALIADAEALRAFEPTLARLGGVIANDPPEQVMETIKAAERELGKVASSSRVKGGLSKARRALRGGSLDPGKAAGLLAEARERYAVLPHPHPPELDEPIAAHDPIGCNIRLPDITIGDLRSQTAALEIGRDGADTPRACMEKAPVASEVRLRARIRELPEGRNQGTYFADDDMVLDEPIRIVTTLTIEDGSIHVD